MSPKHSQVFICDFFSASTIRKKLKDNFEKCSTLNQFKSFNCLIQMSYHCQHNSNLISYFSFVINFTISCFGYLQQS